MKKILFVIAILFFGLSATAQAVLVTPVASNAYITKNGFDIVWASPCAPSDTIGCGGIDLDMSIQGAFGWRVATQADMAEINILATDFVFAGANVDYATGNNNDEATGAFLGKLIGTLPTNDVAVASPWFSNRRRADWYHGYLGRWANLDAPGEWRPWHESIVVRSQTNTISETNPVPEPTTVILLGLGLVGMVCGEARRRKKASS